MPRTGTNTGAVEQTTKNIPTRYQVPVFSTSSYDRKCIPLMRLKITQYLRTKTHVWITVVGVIIVLRVYDQILRSTLIVVKNDSPQQTIQYPTALQQRPQKQQALSAKEPENIVDRQPSYHVVFSTSCSLQQDWESYVFFYHCMRVPGNITRIVSGCNEGEAKKLKEFHDRHIESLADMSIQSFHVHFTPSYGSLYLSEGKHPYKYMNKPYGLRH